MTALEFVRSFSHLPMVMNGNMPIKMSNSEVRRQLQQGGIEINQQRPKPEDTIEFPVTSMVFFPKSKRKVTFR